MDLVPVREQTEAEATPASDRDAIKLDIPDAGLFTLSPERRQLIGVRFSEVQYRELEKTIRTVGRVELDQRKIAEVHPKVSGWIEETVVDFEWEFVRKAEPLFTIYSPQLVATQEELLLALRAREELGDDNPFPRASTGAESLVNNARARLRFWDVTEEQIQELERNREVRRTLTVYSPITGHVIKRQAYPRMWVTPEINVYTIADHSVVWVHVDLYENEIASVRLGQRATMRVPAYPDRVFEGRVTFIWPHLEPTTRTLKVRLEFPNPDLTLKPEMYADVVLRTLLGRRLVVPRSAVLPTGKRSLVFVDREGGKMDIRAIEVGVEADDVYEVLRGLEPGDRVVTAANFLVDAESQVQGAIATWESETTERR